MYLSLAFHSWSWLPCSDNQLTHRSEMSLQADPHLRGTHGVPASLQNLWWRAPEVLFGSQTFDQAIDLWSLGLVLAEMGAGSRFQGQGASRRDYAKAIFKQL